MPDTINLTHVLLVIIGSLITYVLSGIKSEIRETKEELTKTNDLVRGIEKDFSNRHGDIDKRVSVLENCTQSLKEM